MSDEVVAVLGQLRDLLGEGEPVMAPTPSTVPAGVQRRLDVLPSGLGEVIDALVDDRAGQAKIAAELATLDPSLVPVINQSVADVTAARDSLTAAGVDYVDRRNQLAPVEGTPLGQLGVLQAKAIAVGDGAEAVRPQPSKAELRRVVVDALAQRYYEQAKASMLGLGQAGQVANALGSGAQALGSGAAPMMSAASPLQAMSGLASTADPGYSKAMTTGSSRGRGSEAGRDVAERALTALGLPYRWGGGNSKGPTGGGFDCSGLVQWAYAQETGQTLPRTTYDQINLGQRVSPADAQPGDLVFSRFTGRGPEHVQIALGDGKVVHAPQTGDVVKISTMPADAVVKRIITPAESRGAQIV
ncbi:C40 family peptidase [Mycobacterium sp. LTG2003]